MRGEEEDWGGRGGVRSRDRLSSQRGHGGIGRNDGVRMGVWWWMMGGLMCVMWMVGDEM